MDTTLLANGGDPDVTTHWTRDDLDRFPDDGHRRELVEGHLLVSPLTRRRHQAVVGLISFALESWVREGGDGIVYPGVNVDLARDEVEVHRGVDEEPAILRRGGTIISPVLPGFSAPVDDLLGPRR